MVDSPNEVARCTVARTAPTDWQCGLEWNADSSGAQRMLLRSTASAALRELAIYDNGGDASHAIALCLCCNFGLVHVMDNYVA